MNSHSFLSLVTLKSISLCNLYAIQTCKQVYCYFRENSNAISSEYPFSSISRGKAVANCPCKFSQISGVVYFPVSEYPIEKSACRFGPELFRTPIGKVSKTNILPDFIIRQGSMDDRKTRVDVLGNGFIFPESVCLGPFNDCQRIQKTPDINGPCADCSGYEGKSAFSRFALFPV